MVKGIIFDLDNTLYEYNEIHKKAMYQVYQYVSSISIIDKQYFYNIYEKAKSDIKSELKNTASSHNRLLYFQKVLEYLNIPSLLYSLKLYDIYWNYMLENMKPNDNLKILFSELKQKNFKIGICTDLTAHIQHRKLTKLDIICYIDFIVTSEEAGAEKPDYKMFYLCIKKINLNPKEILFVGDDFYKDIIGAHKAGMMPVWYKGYEKKKDAVEYQLINNLNELKNLL